MPVRRSTRIRTKSSYSEQSGSESDSEHETIGSIVTDDRINIENTDNQKEEEALSQGSSSSEEDDDANDDDYVAPGSRKRPNSGGRRVASNKRTKLKQNEKGRPSNNISSAVSRKEQEAYISLQNEFKPTELFEILSSSDDFSCEELASDWLDSYIDNRNVSLANLINFLLDCSGCFTHIGEHDVANNDSSNETIGEIQIMFHEQKKHEFHLLLSATHKKAKFRPLNDNFNIFMTTLMDLAIEKEMIYVENEKEESDEIVIETNPLIIDLLTWIPSMSVSKIRCLRYVSAKAIFCFQDSLARASASLEAEVLFKLRKQLTLERKKKKPKSKTMETLESSISDAEATKTVIENTIDNIIKLCFVHRFKDVDENIRSLAISYLLDWIENNPDYFFKVTFLKYFGWLLSDSSNSVRLQVIRSLHDLIKFSNKRNKNTVDNAALRQFFERFKHRMLEIAGRDIDIQVRLTSVQVLSSINGLGYLDDHEIIDIISLIFFDHEVKVSSSSRDVKFLNEVTKFLANIVSEKTEEFLINNERFKVPVISVTEEQFVKVGVLMRLLHNSLLNHINSTSNLEGYAKVPPDKIKLLQQAAEFLSPKFYNLIETISKLLYEEGNFDGSTIHADADDFSNDLGDIKLFLPETDNNVLFYATVLGGLCTGGIQYNKGQDRQAVTQLILPELEDLFKKMNLDSDQIYTQLLNVIQLLNTEEWNSSESKDVIFNINKTITKRFESSPVVLSNANAITKTYKSLIPYLASLQIPEVTGYWKSCLINVTLSFKKFMESFDIKSDNSITTLYLQYVNKLVILGKEFAIEISETLLDDIVEKFLKPLSELLPKIDSDAISVLDFKLFTSIVTWNLATWRDVIKNNEEPIAVSHTTLNQIRTVLVELLNLSSKIDSNPEIQHDKKFHVLHVILSPLLDIIIAFKMFELDLSEKDSDWIRALRQEYSVISNEDLTGICHKVFLYLESCLGKFLGITLDRVADEDVNYGAVNLVDVDGDPEKELCIYTIKLKGLIKLGILNYSDLTTRIGLNQEKLGPLFESVVSETVFEDEPKNNAESHPAAKLNQEPVPQQYDEVLEPIEEFTQDETVHSPPHPADPIVSSPI